MPNFLTHHLFVKTFFDQNVGDGSFISKNFDFLALGTQGPDPLFYEGIIPGRRLRPLLAKAKLGNEIHRSDGAKFMAYLLSCAEKDDSYLAFVFGQFCHYILDRTCHPYIYYMSGFDENGKLKGKYHYAHSHFESEIDVAMCLTHDSKYLLNNLGMALPTNKKTLAKIEPGMRKAVSEMFARELPDDYYENAVCNMKKAIVTVNRWPQWAINLLGNFVLAGQILPKECNRSVLNETHDTWKHPVTGEEHTESFQELFEVASEIIAAAYKDILNDGFSMATLMPYYNGLNYKGTSPGSVMVYKRD